MALNLGGFSLDEIIDPIIRRVRDEWVPKQRWATQLVVGPALEALEKLPLDQYAEQGVRYAMQRLREALQEWLDGPQSVPLAIHLSARVNDADREEMEAVGINPTLLFFGLQAAIYVIEKLLPYLKPLVGSGGEEGGPVLYAVCCDDSQVDLAFGLAA